ncbi:transposase [Chromatium okenii]|nr:transposase [Chromatium okenii]
MTYSIEFRRRALELKEKFNLTYSEAAHRLGVGPASLARWNKELESQ